MTHPIKRCGPRGWLPALVAGLCALAGCRDPVQPIPLDGGPDANTIVYTDSDGDGLCDQTELSRGTDPTIPDTDGDGVSDRVEIDFGFQPTRTDSPDRELLLYVSEAAGASIDVPIAHIVRAEGESFTGAFQTLPVIDAESASAMDFYSGSIAVAADPMQNVFQIVPEEERFDGVIGRTQLLYQVTFQSPAVEPRGCMRAYPWRYNIKRNDGTLVFARRYLLVVVPEGPAAWCAPVGGCI